MKKTEVKTESEKTFDDFFESESKNLSFTNNTEFLISEEDDENSKSKADFFIKLCKQIFLFLPGTFLLYVVSFVGAIIVMDVFVFQRSFESFEVFGLTSLAFQIISLGVVGILGTFMTWGGLGDIKNKKHLSIPASIIISSAAIPVLLRAVEEIFGFGQLPEQAFHFYFYLLPLILIIPILVKGWVDKEAE